MGSFGGNDSHPMNRHACTHTKERDDETYGHIITHTYTQQIFVCPLDVCSYHFYLFVHDSPIFPPFIPPPPYEADVSKPITFHAAKSNVMRFKLFQCKLYVRHTTLFSRRTRFIRLFFFSSLAYSLLACWIRIFSITAASSKSQFSPKHTTTTTTTEQYSSPEKKNIYI